jgi:hypothetical protein
MRQPFQKIDRQNLPVSLPREFLKAVSEVAVDIGCSRNAAFTFIVRCGLPISRALTANLKEELRRTVKSVRSSKILALPEFRTPAQISRRVRNKRTKA